ALDCAETGQTIDHPYVIAVRQVRRECTVSPQVCGPVLPHLPGRTTFATRSACHSRACSDCAISGSRGAMNVQSCKHLIEQWRISAGPGEFQCVEEFLVIEYRHQIQIGSA